MSKATFSVDGLHCWGCVGTVEKSIHTIPDVHSVIVDLNMKGVSKVTVEADHQVKAEEIQKALNSEGNFTVV